MTHILELRDITKSFRLPSGELLTILNDLNFHIDQGEVVSIIGRSGEGKSTLLNLLGMLDTPTSGAYLCEGEDVAKYRDGKLSRLRGSFFGFVFQQFFLSDRRTALENVAEPFLFGPSAGLPYRLERATELLEKVGLSHRLHATPDQLSGGEQQRVAIARALARRPKVVLADEPTGALDATTGARIIELLFDLVRSEQLTLILVSHDTQIASLADRVLSLSGGQLHEEVSM
ncbi:MAG: ABC transporter ATP-binding protein [Thermomicrobiales bacterium]|nr:ABC transporter ATP-binding protein [Thermomicrobiales bacterium]